MNITRVAKFDLDSLPKTPFQVWFLDRNEVSPKKMFLVTQKRINKSGDSVEIFLPELNSYVDYSPKSIKAPSVYHNVN